MKRDGSQLWLSASDLAGHLACPHLTQLDRALSEGRLRLPGRRDPLLEVLEQRGLAHEARYLETLREQGIEVASLADDASAATAFERTCRAMREGVPAIAQAALRAGRWHGRADVLLRVERPSALGAWSYEVVETKLAAETRAGAVLQLCLYSDLVGQLQGLLPEWMSVVSPGRYAEPERFRTLDFAACYRAVCRRLEGALRADGAAAPTYPEPVPHCDVCRWWPSCDRQRRADDHLSLVAGVTRTQRRELCARGIDTLEKLARASLPLAPRIARGSAQSYARAHAQARLQLDSRGEPRPRFECLEPVEPGRGLARLPAPVPGDVFLDLEGDPFVEGGGREYLFGWVVLDEAGEPRYRCRWALTREDERAAFTAFVGELMTRLDKHPDLHVYHFGIYEPAALKRLMGRHASCEQEIDRLLRGRRFVDLHAVVRQGLRAGVERYTLKDLEPLHGFARELELREASLQLRGVERALELGHGAAIPHASRSAVEAYNRDDCLSTWSLRGWLETLRSELVARGCDVPRPQVETGEASETLDERRQRLLALFERLTRDVPADPQARSEEQHARWLLAHLIEWHWRESKVSWWEYYRLRDTAEDELLHERGALAGLELVGRFGGTDACPIHRYRFPAQDHDVRAGQTLHTTEGSELGDVVELAAAARTVDVKKRKLARDLHPWAAFAHDAPPLEPLPGALESLASWVAEHGIDAAGAQRAARDLLLRRPPRGIAPAAAAAGLRAQGETALAAARRLVLELEDGVLPVQGPPGSGKTYMGARMICALVRAGKKVGITAVSHKVIRNLLEATLCAAAEEGLELRCVQKVKEESEDARAGLLETPANAALLQALASGAAQVGGGTAWAWARADFAGVLDVLVVDEAGQMSLANTLAAARAARSLVLLGDPQQLEQPIQGSHPEGSDVSALEHLLAAHETLPDDRGLFLGETWRLHPAICAFTSEIFYEGRLAAHAGCENQRLAGDTPFAGAGLWLVPVEHSGNQSSAPEEVERIAAIVDSLLSGAVSWIDAAGASHPLTRDDLLIVAPYNAQVGALSARLPGARVGTVDRFQGQEAPVVIYSMTTSSTEEAPRGMEFLYSLHRLNVATSRARCACILVASPRLLEPEVRTPQQLRLANALCRYAERAAAAPAG